MSRFSFPQSALSVAAIPVALATLGWASDAQAQAWLANRQHTEGAGLRAGNVEFHPGIGAEIGYDSNWLLRSERANALNGPPNAPRRDAGLLRLTPHLSLRSLGAERKEGQDTTPPPVAFDLGVSATYREFLGAQEIRRQRNVGINVDGKLMFAPQRPLSFDLLAGYTRLIRPNTLGDPALSFNTSAPYVGGDLKFNPGRGTFDITGGYRFTAVLFEQQEARGYSNLRHDISLSETWKFRPRTALFHTTNLSFINYQNADRAATIITDSTPLRTRFGLNGLVFDRFAATAAVGYGASFVERGAASTRQFDSVIGNVEIRAYLTGNPKEEVTNYLPMAQSQLTLGFERDFQTVFLANFATVHRGYLGLSAYLAGRVLVSVQGGLGAHTYEPVFNNTGGGGEAQVTNSFTVIRPDAQVYGEYRFTNSLALTLTGRYSQAISDQMIRYNNFPPAGAFAMSWQRFEAFAGVRWFL